MAGKSRLPRLTLNAGQLSELQQLSQSRTAPLREVQRARILCHYHAGETITGIALALKMTRKSVRKWIDKAFPGVPVRSRMTLWAFERLLRESEADRGAV